eukprot:SAG22_NODE_203_length_15320_cov_14.023516_7_plen_351_part_00
MNDPNGPFYDEATQLYHLFAQYNPHGAKWGDMNWYHAVSKDMVHWAHLPVALEPDHAFDCGGEFSGSATVMPDAAGTPVLSVSVACGKWVFFAIPEDKAADPLMIKWRKNGTMPVSGAQFSGPLFDAPAYSSGGFRDPTTAWQGTDKVWRMATGCGDKKKGGACLFKSENFVNWTAVGWLHHPQVQALPFCCASTAFPSKTAPFRAVCLSRSMGTAVGWLHHPHVQDSSHRAIVAARTARHLLALPLHCYWTIILGKRGLQQTNSTPPSAPPKLAGQTEHGLLGVPGLFQDPGLRQVGAQGLGLWRLVVGRDVRRGGRDEGGHLHRRLVRRSRRQHRRPRAAEVRLRAVL